jgi:hypothetical protein
VNSWAAGILTIPDILHELAFKRVLKHTRAQSPAAWCTAAQAMLTLYNYLTEGPRAQIVFKDRSFFFFGAVVV